MERIGLGTVAKMRLNFTTSEGKDIEEGKIADFSVHFFVSPSRQLVINKKEMIAEEDGYYTVFVDTAQIGIGKLQYKAVLSILDPQYRDTFRKEVTLYNTDIEIYR